MCPGLLPKLTCLDYVFQLFHPFFLSSLLGFLPCRDYRRYFYTHKLTSKTQWDYPDADEISTEETRAAEGVREARVKERDGEISSTTRSGDRRAPDSSYRSKKQGASQKDIITKAATLPPPPPPPAEEHPVVKSLQLMYGSTSGSDSEDEQTHKDRKNKTAKAEPKLAGPAPSTIPLPPAPPDNRGDREKEDRHDRGRDDRAEKKERKEKHKSKKKKKEKSKKKDREKREEPTASGPIGPVGPPVLPQNQVATEGQITASEEMVPVYGPQSGPEIYGQNDEPLQFGAGVVDGNQPVDALGQPIPAPGEANPTVSQTEGAELSHPPETYIQPEAYHQSETYHQPETYATNTAWVGGGDQSEVAPDGTQGSFSYEGAPAVEPSSSATPSGEDKKKKKKEKMGTSNISLKKKHVSSMVQKWQKVKKEVEEEERNREEKEAEIRRKLQELQEDHS